MNTGPINLLIYVIVLIVVIVLLFKLLAVL